MARFTDSQVIPFKQQLIYDVVADVGRYSEFVPWCLGTRVYNRRENEFDADILVGFNMFRERYTSRVTLTPNSRIESRAIRGPLKHLINIWTFEDIGEGKTKVGLDLDFEFNRRVLNQAIGGIFGDATIKMMDAFAARAEAIQNGEVSKEAKPAEAPRASGASPFLSLVREQRHD